VKPALNPFAITFSNRMTGAENNYSSNRPRHHRAYGPHRPCRSSGARGQPLQRLRSEIQTAAGSRNTEFCYLGQITLAAGSVAIGTNYGGNGTTTFALPDLTKSGTQREMTYGICTEGSFHSRD
jgi:Phage Tail Collar Domain